MASLVKTDTISSTTASSPTVTLPTPTAPASWYMGRNVVINGDMQIAQRATSVASVTGAGYQTCDRWHEYTTGSAGTFTYTQETLSSGNAYADGFQKAYRIDCTTAVASPAAGVEHYVRQKFEGYNVQQFKKGTANATTYVLSFWVKSNQTGTGICAMQDHDNSRYIGGTYTISVADTWEKKTVNFAADATGVMTNDNGTSLDVRWYVGAGTTYTSGTLPTAWEAKVNANVAAGNQITVGTSTSNDWAITGVQLEVGSAATPYERKTFGQELTACQRYYCKSFAQGTDPANGNGVVAGAMLGKGVTTDDTEPFMSWQYPSIMRAAPSITLYNHRSGGTTGQWDNHGSSSGANARILFANDFCVRIDNSDQKLAAANAWMIHAVANAEL